MNADITTSKDGKTLTITVDLTKEFGQSKSGKTILIGTTGGNTKVDTKRGSVFVGANIYRFPDAPPIK